MPNEITPAGSPTELHKLQFEYAWKWFCFHADQRMKMFNFMLIVFGIFAAGVVNALDKHLPTVAIAGLCFFAASLGFIFIRLDRRNRDLVWLGEDVLIDLERRVIFGEDKKIKDRFKKGDIGFGILWRQMLEGRRSPDWTIGGFLCDAWLGKHRIWLRWISFLFAILFSAAGVWMIWLRPPSP